MKITWLYLLITLTSILNAQSVRFSFQLEPHYTIVERADYSKRLNGNYLGYVNQEVRAVLESREQRPGVFQVEGYWYTAQEIKKEGVMQALPLDGEQRLSFSQDMSGQMSNISLQRGPQLRNFPVFPNDAVSPGDRWEAPLYMEIEDLRGDQWAEIPLYCGYSFEGEGEYQGREVYFVKAQFAIRYTQGRSYQADNFLSNASGSHVVTITIDKQTMSPILMRDSFHEQWSYKDGQTLETRGFNLTFFKGVSLLNQGDFLRGMSGTLGGDITVINGEEQASQEDTNGQENGGTDDGQTSNDHNGQMQNGQNGGTQQDDSIQRVNSSDHQEVMKTLQEEDVTVIQNDQGLTLSLNNLHFMADQAVLLAEDRPLLDQIAQVLSSVPEKTFLIKGHTADVGSMESQMLLSMQRAQVIVEELIERGIDADRFMYSGMGGTEPMADNSTPQGRAVNRRVEITILED